MKPVKKEENVKETLRKGNWVKVKYPRKKFKLSTIEGFDSFGTFLVSTFGEEEHKWFPSSDIYLERFDYWWVMCCGFVSSKERGTVWKVCERRFSF